MCTLTYGLLFHSFTGSQAGEALALDNPQTRYYDDMKGILDLVLTFNEHGTYLFL
jgi:hypothetical protein